MKEYFYLPDDGNTITASDIEKGILRITVHAKPFFPQHDATITVIINGVSKDVQFKKRDGRSDLLHLGKEAIKGLEVNNKSKLKVTKKSANKFVIENEPCNFSLFYEKLNYKDLLKLKKDYWQLLKDNPFSAAPISGDSIDMIKYFKRKIDGKHKPIGPYKNISVFEAANRIASDLVILNGLIQLIEDKKEPKNSIMTICLGNKHIPGCGDFTINGKEGEAFNVASSFYKAKMRSTTNSNKWIDKNLTYILVNADVFEEIKDDGQDDRIRKVKNWDKEI